MRRIVFVGAALAAAAVMIGCTTIPPAFVGDPNTHGFVIVEGEAAITQQKDGETAIAQQKKPREPSLRFSVIEEVTLQSVERPTQIVRGRNQAGLTWFSDLEPGTYRVKDIRLNNERGEAIYRLPQDALPEPALSFSIGAGELRYLGYIEISQFIRHVVTNNGSVELANVLRFNVVHNRDEMRAWERVYDLYARTPWEALLLKKIETVQKPGSN